MVLSALRSGARVKVVLSGEPGQSISTDGFIRDPNMCLQVMTNYLGTGYAFGIHRLAETFTKDLPSGRPAHILIISDSDMFTMLEEKGSKRLGWDVAREALQRCGGGATYVLQIPDVPSPALSENSSVQRMLADGWNVHTVVNLEELLAFARKFSREQYAEVRP